MPHSRFAKLVLLLALCTFAAVRAAADEPWRFENVSRVVAVSDVHGAYDAFVRTLQAASVIDEEAQWSAGDAHLVITGDLLDRGADSRPVMDLLMRLEPAAETQGGKVHLLLGNHEVMNLVGDLRYVDEGEYAAFAADETAEERALHFERFAARAPDEAEPQQMREQFDRAHPPGFFAHRRAFRADGRYGSWLLDKPLVVVIDGTAFVHGGLSPMAERLGLEGLNRGMGEELRAYVNALGLLTEKGLLLPGDSFYAHPRILEDRLPGEARDEDVRLAVHTIMNPPEASIHHLDGPLWYRGQVGCPALVERDRLLPALDAIGARRVVIGHTPTASRDVVSRLDGRVIEIDTGMLSEYYRGSGHALEIRGESVSVYDESGALVPVLPDPRPRGTGAVTAERLEALLGSGEVVLGAALTDGMYAASVSDGVLTVDAVFYPQDRRNSLPEVAAYRVDRLLGLEMLPVTVSRNVDGREGALQFHPPRLVNETQRAETRAGGDAWCPLPAQWAAMYLFDALIYMPERGATAIQYDQASWRLYLTGHGDAFDTSRSRPRRLRSVKLDVSGSWQAALGELDAAWIDASLADVLDMRRRRALLSRRDALLSD